MQDQVNLNQQALISQQGHGDGEKGKEGAFQIMPLKQFDMLAEGGGKLEQIGGAALQSIQIPGAGSFAGKESKGMFGVQLLGTMSRLNMNAGAEDLPGGRAEPVQQQEPMHHGGDMAEMQSAGQDLHSAGGNHFQEVDTRQPEPPQPTPMMDQQPIQQGRGWG